MSEKEGITINEILRLARSIYRALKNRKTIFLVKIALHIKNLMLSENKALLFTVSKKNSKKIIFPWSETTEIFLIKFCMLQLFYIKS